MLYLTFGTARYKITNFLFPGETFIYYKNKTVVCDDVIYSIMHEYVCMAAYNGGNIMSVVKSQLTEIPFCDLT